MPRCSKTVDSFNIDSHKLIYHPREVNNWLKGQDIYPIYVEISPSRGCNQRCIFCALDYLKHKPLYLDAQVLKKFLNSISKRGTKSVMFAGEGEPLLHKNISELITFARSAGLDTAVTTNGALLSKGLLTQIIPALSWLRISLNAGKATTYAAIHRAAPEDFRRVIRNIETAVKLKRDKRYSCTLGVQFLLLNENYKEAALLAGILSRMGADYLIIKPYSQHPRSFNRLKSRLDYKKFLFLEDKLKKYGGKNFQVIFRRQTMDKLKKHKPYRECLGFYFWAYLASDGDLYACSTFLGDKRFIYGNLYKDNFGKIWKGEKRKKILKMMAGRWDIKRCRDLCRLDNINRYLWELKNPSSHVNFI